MYADCIEAPAALRTPHAALAAGRVAVTAALAEALARTQRRCGARCDPTAGRQGMQGSNRATPSAHGASREGPPSRLARAGVWAGMEG